MPSIYNLVGGLGLLLFGLIAQASGAPKWAAITSKVQPDCGSQSPCRILEGNSSFEAILKPAIEKSKNVLRKLQIRSLKSGDVQEFELVEMNNIAGDDFFALYKVQMRPGGAIDLALHAYDSAREGEVYYYFLYDPVKQQFVMSEGTFPKLIYEAKSKYFVSEFQGAKFVLEKSLQFSPAD